MSEENYELRLIITGGEDAPGFAGSLSLAELRDMMARERREAQEREERLSARLAECERERDVWKSKSTMHSRDAADMRQRTHFATARASAMEAALGKLIEAAACIRHWHDAMADCSGMVVSAEHVRALWVEIDEARATLSDAPALSPAGGEDVTAAKHDWHERFDLTCCRVCGIVRRADGGNDEKPCNGLATVSLRAS